MPSNELQWTQNGRDFRTTCPVTDRVYLISYNTVECEYESGVYSPNGMLLHDHGVLDSDGVAPRQELYQRLTDDAANGNVHFGFHN